MTSPQPREAPLRTPEKCRLQEPRSSYCILQCFPPPRGALEKNDEMLGMDACYQTHVHIPNTEPKGALSALHLPETTIQRMKEGGKGEKEKERRSRETKTERHRESKRETEIGRERAKGRGRERVEQSTELTRKGHLHANTLRHYCANTNTHTVTVTQRRMGHMETWI